MIAIVGRGSYTVVPFPPDRKRIDIGDFYSDATKIRNALGWRPAVGLDEGLSRTLDYYSLHKERYL
jgi:nucleoside-diphosphate-sugar epimerase